MWLNGRSIDHAFKISIDYTIDTIRRLKDIILIRINKNYAYDRLSLFNKKGLELDDNDIQYLENNESIYLSLDGNNS